MKKILQLILSLTLISAVCAAVLAIVNNATKERIANLATLKANNAARAVLPANVKAIVPREDPADASLTAFVGYADDAKTQIAGYAVPGLTAKGYGGNIRLMVGLNPDRTVISYQVLAAGETPGLGSNLTTPAFIARFKGQPAADVAVTKDGGKIEALTSATITSRAVCDAVADAARRIDRIEGKDTGATSAPAPAVNPEGKMLFDPSKPEEALKVLPKGTTTATALPGKGRFPVFEGKDAAGKTTGFAAVGTGKATGPHGDLAIIYQFGFTAKRAPSFNPPPRMVNQPAIEMTDMENAQRTAYNAALQDALSQLR
ncbi:MAG: RnfABCDGE type electron transport complex subunit G [Kiritimatiellae bacterium]|nr:RnfABCDGE type electron transport complex subunit G [Kiritimatiellia bacterium]